MTDTQQGALQSSCVYVDKGGRGGLWGGICRNQIFHLKKFAAFWRKLENVSKDWFQTDIKDIKAGININVIWSYLLQQYTHSPVGGVRRVFIWCFTCKATWWWTHDVHCWLKWQWPPVVQSEWTYLMSDVICERSVSDLWPLCSSEKEGSDRQRWWSCYDTQHTICRGCEEREEEEKEREEGEAGGGRAWGGGTWGGRGGAWHRGEFDFKVK